MFIREISAERVTEAVRRLAIKANIELDPAVEEAICAARQTEASPVGQAILDQLIENAAVAREQRIPICQDTGLAVVFVEIGQDVHIEGCLEDAINEGVRRGYKEGYLRNSVDRDAIDRVNTRDNTPAIIHYEDRAGGTGDSAPCRTQRLPTDGDRCRCGRQLRKMPLSGQEGLAAQDRAVFSRPVLGGGRKETAAKSE